jgi:hypothetical protein
MKKMILTTAAFALVVVSSIALAPTKAEAFPAFARQTGASCLSCHFQTFPALNAFGRAFMMGSFTDVGDQALVEDDNLSIPAVLNASFEVRAGAVNTNTTGAPSTTAYNIPDAARLFVAGRIGSNTGAIIMFTGGQNKMANNVNMNMAPTPVWMLLNSWDVGDFKVGLGAHKSPWGGSNIMEVSNVFGHRGDKLGGQDISAITNGGFTKMTTGIGAWIGNDLGIIQFSAVAPATLTTGFTNVGSSFGKLVRAVATLDVGGWDTLIGFGIVTGSAGKGPLQTVTVVNPNTSTLDSSRVPMNMQFIDAQIQGDVGDMSVGIYGDWAHAKGKTSTAGTGNFYGIGGAIAETGARNDAGNKYDGFSIRAEVEPIDRVIVGIGYGYQKLTRPAGDITNKVFHLAATYKLYQNFDINILYNSEKLTDSMTAANTGTTRTTIIEFDALM